MKLSFHDYWRFLMAYLRPLWRRVLLMSLLLVGTTCLGILNPQLVSHFIDSAQAGGAVEVLLMIALLFLAVTLLQQLVSVGAAVVCEDVSWRATNQLRYDLVAHCLRLDLAFYEAHLPGELIERVDGDVTVLEKFFTVFIINILGNVLLLLGTLIVLYLITPLAGFVLTVFVVLAILLGNSIKGLALPHWVLERQASADLFGFIEERLSGAEEIHANGGVAYAMQHVWLKIRGVAQSFGRARRRGNLVFIITNAVFWFAQALGLAIAIVLYQHHAISLGTAFIIAYYTGNLILPLEGLSTQLQEMQNFGASMQRIMELRTTSAPIQNGAGEHLAEGALAVSYEDVSFSYGAELVLHQLSFTVPAGAVLGVLGRTGSGKTTLARLLLRLYAGKQTGTLRLGEVDIQAVDLVELRQRVGLVTQHVQLFHGSIRDNLTFFDPTVDEERLLQAIYELELTDWYRSLSHGLDTVLAGSEGLSAGEAQLLAFTRLLLKHPGLVILDEASARLDPATARVFERAVDRLLEGRTGIIIAHRLETLRRADFILVLEDGHMVEFGPRTQLEAEKQSRFAQLLQAGLEEVLV